MARPLRLEFPGAVYHLTARGNARQHVCADEADRRHVLELLGREVAQQGWRCYAYCLMGNHDQLLIETPEGNLVAGMRRLNGASTQAFNRRYRRVGHVLQGRYKAIVVDRDAYLIERCRYIVRKPVRAMWKGSKLELDIVSRLSVSSPQHNPNQSRAGSKTTSGGRITTPT